jgi:voltage-gated potassium channel
MNDSPAGSRQGVGAFQIALLLFTIVVLCSLVIDTTLPLPKEVSRLVHMVDTLACAVFFTDFCLRLYRAQSKLAFMKWGWIDFIACIPNLEVLRWGRMVRVLRIIRLLRGVRSVQKAVAIMFASKTQGSAVMVVFAAVLLVVFSSVSVLVCERQGDGNIKTAEEAVWWSIATITTVGYGDRYPITTEGRVVGVILMVAGVSMFGCLSGLAASFFLGTQGAKSSETTAIMAKLDRLQATVEALSQERESFD